MSRYIVEIKPQAQEDLKVLSKSEPKAYQKALTLIAELYDHQAPSAWLIPRFQNSLVLLFM